MKGFLEKIEELLEWGGIKKQIVLLVLSGVSLLISVLGNFNLTLDLAWVAIVLCGIPIIIEAMLGLITSFDIRAGVLVSIALVASVCLKETFAAGEVAFIMQLGELLEEITVTKARAGIEKLAQLTPQTARVIRGNIEEIIESGLVKVNDIIRVLPGEAIAVDGVIVSGETSIDQSVVTGESMPVDKKAGDEVFSGTVNQFGTFEMKATKVGEDSSIQRMARLVRSADADKAKIVGIADRWATWIVGIALLSAILAWIITGEVIRAVTILVVFCPCALVLATPTAIMAAIGNATKHGFLVRVGDALERLSKVNRIAFDKTGTLTHGTPEVKRVESISEYTSEQVYFYAASVEQYSEHPLGKAIVRCYNNKLGKCEGFDLHLGAGVSAIVNGKKVKAGSLELVNGEKSIMPDTEGTVIYVSVDGLIIGYIVLADTVRSEGRKVIEKIKSIGITPTLLTGDNMRAALSVKEQLGIDEVRSGCLPEDKINAIDSYTEKGETVCMIGDGINDAPALKKAYVGIAMGGIGSDIAVDAADIVLVNDMISELPHLLYLSKRMMFTIKLNIIISMLINLAAIIFASTGILGPVVGALVHNLGSVLVILNSALLLVWKRK